MPLTGLCLAVALLAPPNPRDAVLARVPPDVAVVLLVQNLRDQAATVAGSPFAQWAGAKLGPKVAGSGEFTVLKGFEKILTDALGVTAAELRDDVLGDAVAFAFTPGTADQPETDRGIILLHARDPKKLATVLEKLNAAQRERNEITGVETLTHNGAEYRKRTKPGGGAEFFFLQGPLFGFSGQEDMLKAALDRGANDTAVSPAGAGLKALGLGDAFLAAWINPRALDKDLAAQAAAEENPSKKAFLEQLAKVWAAADGVGVGLTVAADVELKLAAAVKLDRLPSELRPFLAENPDALAVPTGAMLAGAGRIRPEDLIAAVASFAPPAERTAVRKEIEKAIGPVILRDNVASVLAVVGPQVQFAAYPPGSGQWPPRMVLDVHLAADARGRLAVAKLTKFWGQLVAVEFNKTHEDQIDFTELDGLTVYRNDAVFPPGFRPMFGERGGHFVFTTAEGGFAGTRPVSAAFAVCADAALGRDYLKAHGDPVAAWLAGVQSRDAAELKKDLATVTELLEPIERVDLTATTTPTGVSLSLRVKTVKSLK